MNPYDKIKQMSDHTRAKLFDVIIDTHKESNNFHEFGKTVDDILWRVSKHLNKGDLNVYTLHMEDSRQA